ncbi:DEAD/DEAH box helicase family protein [Flavobacterium sp.]|uniref:DEAD/DEAH box helicase family protein n=1 Tax=Flavobacterium sp. TaxID=239 RepID=UPI00375308A6
MSKNYFPEKSIPKVYCYTDTRFANCIKVGYTTKTAVERVAAQYPVKLPNMSYEIILEELAIRNDGTLFTDKDIHKLLNSKKVKHINGEWFECALKEVKACILEIKTGVVNEEKRTLDFGLRPEQTEAINKTEAYFKSSKKENKDQIPHFLWNAKMRFGKTFTTYQLAKKMGWKKILVLTFKPAVQSAWKEDLESHLDFNGWQFVSNKEDDLSFENIDTKKPFVFFGSFQDLLGKNSAGGIKSKNEWVHTTNWDCVAFDEYHYGAWRENAKELFEAESKREQEFAEGFGMDYFDESNMPITTDYYLYLSGTPFRAISSGEFLEDQIFNWTYSDEQKAKIEWKGDKNPYLSLPRMVMLTYRMPDAIIEIAMKGEFNEFDLNVFFSADGEQEHAKFKYENEVQKWLDLIRGNLAETTIDNLKMGHKKPPMPFSDTRLLNVLQHTFWFLPTVASCHAMKNLIDQKQNKFYHDYNVIVCAGTSAGIGVEALKPVEKALANPLQTKTITLSCGKLTTGVSVKPWTGIFMLRNSSSPETYFQAMFRVQTPWTIKNPDKNAPNREEIIKHECYVFDFAPNRALRQIADYSCKLNTNQNNFEKNVQEFINFLPILAYDGSSMNELSAIDVLDYAFKGTTATLLAKRWEHASLVNVDNITLQRLMNSKEAMEALKSIEGFRNLNQDIETIINKSESIKKTKAEANEKELTPKQKKELTDEEKEYKNKRKEIQDKLIKFATRIPVFMYLTDYRERSLKDVITQLEPALFKKVTGLNVKDFELLVSLGVFNNAHMNLAVGGFKRYEDASLSYSGINKHPEEKIGLYDTVISVEEFKQEFENTVEK